jgi:hypothetical protein
LRLDYKAPSLVTIPGNSNASGNVHFLENKQLFPQGVLRCFWISGVKEGESRGNHAHWKESQLLVAVTGRVDVHVSGQDGKQHHFMLKDPSTGLFIPPLNWIKILFSDDAVLLGLGDLPFSENDFIRDQDHFGRLQKENS